MKNYNFTVYYDEAGRGPLAGPVYIGLICPLGRINPEDMKDFCDSKQISESKRNQHFELIQSLYKKEKLIAKSARATATEIDQYGMTLALHCAILRGMIQIFSDIFPENFSKFINIILPNPLSTKICKKNLMQYSDVLSTFAKLHAKGVRIKLILDGNSDFGLKKNFPFREFETIVSGDDKVKEISMASIVAKVSRDRIMENLPNKYNRYNFPKHKGYGTKEHKNLIEKYGPSNIHRKLFLKWIFPNHKIKKNLPEMF